MSEPRVFPSVDELRRLPTPLQHGEVRVLDFFLELLAPDWEIFVQPHLNGLRPDFVLLHPENGIAVFEVKDWDLGAMEYFFRGTPPTLCGRRNGETFSKAADDPITKVKTYKDEIHRLYCPSLPAGRNAFGVTTAGVVFPKARQSELDTLFGPPYREHLSHDQNPLVGIDALASNDLRKVFPLHDRRSSSMTLEVADELRSWLIEPEVSREQRAPLELDRRQRGLATSRTKSGFRRIKGPAGSGKSLVLAARAAQLAKEGKTVLVVTYNITLLNYLRDLSVRWSRERGVRNNVTWLNFHQWCRRVAFAGGQAHRYLDFWNRDEHDIDDVLGEKLAELVQSLYAADESRTLPRYDAILVDEGQDYRLSWWNALRAARNPDGEMLLVADPTQDLYGTARAWTDEAMVGAGFPGGTWSKLDDCHRMPPSLVHLVRDFAERFLPSDDLRVLPVPIQGELPIGRTSLRWFQVEEERAVEACVAEILGLPSSMPHAPLSWADITFLTSSKAFGRAVVRRLEAHGVRVLHTFYDGEEGRRRKLAFFKGAPKVKATTLHSFKGWEGRALVVHFGDLPTDEAKAAAYAALTRLKRHEESCALSVVCSWEAGEDYGRTWPTFKCWRGDGLGAPTQVLEDFDEQWLPVMAALAASDGVTVEPGADVMFDGRVIDLDLATVTKGDQGLHLVDGEQSSAQRVESALKAQGARAMCIRPGDEDLVAKILVELEGSA